MTVFGRAHGAYQNVLDGRLFFTCGAHQSISRFHSIHDNHANDRLFELVCSNVNTSRSLPEKCNWTARKCHAIKYKNPYCHIGIKSVKLYIEIPTQTLCCKEKHIAKDVPINVSLLSELKMYTNHMRI